MLTIETGASQEGNSEGLRWCWGLSKKRWRRGVKGEKKKYDTNFTQACPSCLVKGVVDHEPKKCFGKRNLTFRGADFLSPRLRPTIRSRQSQEERAMCEARLIRLPSPYSQGEQGAIPFKISRFFFFLLRWTLHRMSTSNAVDHGAVLFQIFLWTKIQVR